MNNYENTISAAEDLVESMRLMKILMLEANLATQGALLATLPETSTPYQDYFEKSYLPVVEELDSWRNW